MQAPDLQPDDPGIWKVVTERAPTRSQMADLEYAWNAARLVKSNAIVFARDNAIVGLAPVSRTGWKAWRLLHARRGTSAHGAAMASDAYFPFADGIEQAISAGMTSVIQPGGSIRDQEVIDAANAAGIAMVFTGTRHFRH